MKFCLKNVNEKPNKRRYADTYPLSEIFELNNIPFLLQYSEENFVLLFKVT